MPAFEAKIIHFESLPSTNTEAARRAMQGAAEGLCVVAREQTAGRGRLQRMWVSPANAGLYFSLVLRPQVAVGMWSLLPLMAAIVVNDALLELCALETDIKWPNDVLFAGRKLCGILAETIETDAGRAAIIGIGMNLTSQAFAAELRDLATSIEDATGTIPKTDQLLDALLSSFKNHYQTFQAAEGAEQILREWSMRSSYAEGKRVRIVNGGEVFEGTTRGLESDGALRVETDSGEIRIVRAGDVSLRPSLQYRAR